MISFITTGRLTLRLTLGGALAWSFVVALQVGWVLLAWLALGRRRIEPSRAVDLYAMGHGPWSVCLLALSALAILVPPERYRSWRLGPESLLLLALPLVLTWSALITSAFLAAVLGATRRQARWGVALHTAMVWGSIVLFYLLSGQLWPRIVGLARR